MSLDRFDIAILRQIQTDGRISNRDLAERVGLSHGVLKTSLPEHNKITYY